MSIKLWTSPLSYNSLRPELVLAEKGIEDVEIVPADIITGKHKVNDWIPSERNVKLILPQTPEFWEKSIFGRVPLMEDGDFVLFESRAIARYLAMKYLNTGPKLMPVVNDPKTNGMFGMWMIVEVEEFNLHAVPVINETIVAP
jgi:glutathione S-transferase